MPAQLQAEGGAAKELCETVAGRSGVMSQRVVGYNYQSTRSSISINLVCYSCRFDRARRPASLHVPPSIEETWGALGVKSPFYRTCLHSAVQISAKVDYGMRALLALAASPVPMTSEALASEQLLPAKFLGVILNDLRRAGIVASHRGRDAGYNLARSAADISAADVIRALEGPLAEVHGMRPETTTYPGPAEHLQDVWIALRASLRAVLEHVTIEDIVKGDLPPEVARLVAAPGAWAAHRP